MKTISKMLMVAVASTLFACGGNKPFDNTGACVWKDSKGNDLAYIAVPGDHDGTKLRDECIKTYETLEMAKSSLILNGVVADEDSFNNYVRGTVIYFFDDQSQIPQATDGLSPYVAYDASSKTLYLEKYMRGAAHGFLHIIETANQESDDRIKNHEDWNVAAMGYADADIAFQHEDCAKQGIAY